MIQYLDLLQDVLDHGELRGTRNAEAISLFQPARMDIDLSKGQFPALTTKKVAVNWAISEAIWVLRGSSDLRVLADLCNTIPEKTVWWEDYKKHRPRLEATTLEYSIGKSYGYQMRSGIDQLSVLIDGLINDPTSRRHIISLWNPAHALREAATLPPCWGVYMQFYVRDNKLSLSAMARSNDLILGCPFNLVMYATIMLVVSRIVGLDMGSLHYNISDAHIYVQHLEAAKTQLARTPTALPTVTLNKQLTSTRDINYLVSEDFTLHNYNPQATIKAPLLV